MATTMRISAARTAAGIAVGLGLAALWGVVVEAAAWIAAPDEPLARIARAARLARVGEVALFAAAAALLGTGLCLLIPALRRRISAEPLWIPSALGLAAAAGLALAFGSPPPEPSEIRMSQDPLLARALPLALAAAAAAVVVILAFRAPAPPRWLHALQAAAASALLVGAWLPDGGVERAGRPDVFLISIDTLRADHLGCYGYPLPTSPAMDALCEAAIVYEAAMAPASETMPSYASLLSGTLQTTHGVYNNYDKLDGANLMLAERLRDAGYRTAAVLEGSFPGSFANVGQGFDLLIQRGITAIAPTRTPSEGLRSLMRGTASFAGEHLRVDHSVTTDASVEWLRSLPAGVPVFAHFYYPYPHAPYVPPPRYLQLVPARSDLPDALREPIHRYDAEIRFADEQVRRLVDALREVGRYDDAWVVLTSDHGEELGRRVEDREEPFFGHSRYLFDSSVRVPLIVKPPRADASAPRREAEVVTTVSLASTLLALLGLPADDALVGPLPGLVDGGASGIAFSLARNATRGYERASLRRGPWRLIETRRPDLRVALLEHRDGRESPDRSPAEPEVTRSLLELLHAVHPPTEAEDGSGAGDTALPERERRMLEALGYIE